MITTTGLTKRYGRITAVDGVDLDVREGDVYGFLGANGSGKTTTVRMLLGLVLATSGTVDLLGRRMPGAARDVLPDVGAIIEDPAAYPHLSGRANLALFDAMDRSGHRMAGGALQVVEVVLEHQPAAVQHADAGAHLLDLGEQVAGDEHRGAGPVELEQQGPDVADALRVQAVRRFVEDQQPR